MMNKVIKDILIEICKKLEGEIEIKNDFYKQFHILLNFLNKKINTIYYLYDHNLILLWTNGKNTRIINKSLEDLREVGYDKFTEGYHPDNKVI
ncbi:MAG: hypothetical protein KA792_10365, partial [Bacteroidales bacterium]|nr:hypothetical protein [Bacteroidales bacterium]